MVYKDEFFYLTTTGWKSGAPHEIEIWYVEHNGRYYLISERREQAHWVQNLQQRTSVSFWVQGKTYIGTAQPLDDAELSRTIQKLFQQKYGWNDGLVVEIIPNI